MANVLLINPSYQRSYGVAKASIVNPIMPSLGLATVAAGALQRGHNVEILDMSWREYDHDEIAGRIRKLGADVVGVTETTPLMNQLRDISILAKDISKNILMVRGGAHPSAMHESLFSHETMSYERVLKYVDFAYRRVILFNPSYKIRRMIRGVCTGEFFWDIYYFIKFISMPSTNKGTPVRYYAQGHIGRSLTMSTTTPSRANTRSSTASRQKSRRINRLKQYRDL